MNNGLRGNNSKVLANQFRQRKNVTVPNNLIPVYVLEVDSNEPSADVVLPTRGTGALLRQIPDNLVTGGNKRGLYAIDMQILRAAATQVAGGSYATISGGYSNTTAATATVIGGGYSNVASGVSATVTGGYSNTASGLGSTVIGVASIASGTWSIALGVYANTLLRGSSYAWGTEASVTAGRQQSIGGGLGNTTTNSTIVLTSNAAAAGTANQMVLQNNSVMYLTGSVIARDTVTNDTAYWELKVLAKRGAAAVNTAIVGTPGVVKMFSDAATTGWAITATADTVNGAIAFTATTNTVNAVRWHIRLDGNEVA